MTSVALMSAAWFAACNNSQGDTDGGSAVSNLGNGNAPVSNGGFGAKLTIDVVGDDSNIEVGEIRGYRVVATDPRGLPLANQRVFCESERGIAILEPSSGGVAFEHTSDDGHMSGKIGCITSGSFLFECRLDQGFNLVDRVHLICRGDTTAYFPGAAGGHLGGGNLVEGETAPTPTPTAGQTCVPFNGSLLCTTPTPTATPTN